MKKLMTAILAAMAINAASAYDITNTVTIVSNIYNRIAEVHYITNNVKNTHVNYYFTNNVYTVTNTTLLVSQQTFKTNTTVNLDVSQQAIADARGYANAASSSASSAQGYANTAAGHVTDAQEAAEEAAYYAAQAHGQVQPIIDEGNRQVARVNSAGSSNVGSVNSAGTTMINNINAKQAWFEQHFGQMVTNINHNYYDAEDQTARAMASSAQVMAQSAGTAANAAQATANAAQTAAALAGSWANEAKQGVLEAKQGVTDSFAYTTAVSNKLEQGVSEAKRGVADSFAYTTAVSNKLEQGVAGITNKTYETVVGWEYIPGGDWTYEICDDTGTRINYFAIKIDDGTIKNVQDPDGYLRYKSIGTHGFYVRVRFAGDTYQVGLCGTSVSDQTVKDWLTFHDKSDDWHKPPLGTTDAGYYFYGYTVRFMTARTRDIVNYTKFDPNMYDANGIKTIRTAFLFDLNALSNWVEQTFMKK